MKKLSRLADDLAVHLRDRILSGALAPGTHLTEQTLAAEYDVARPTVRTAISLLQSDGLVYREPHLPATVAQISADSVPEIIALLEVTELYALERLLDRDPDTRQLRHSLNDSGHTILDVMVGLSASERLIQTHRRSTFELLLAQANSLAAAGVATDTGSDSMPAVSIPNTEPIHELVSAIVLHRSAAAHKELLNVQNARRESFGLTGAPAVLPLVFASA